MLRSVYSLAALLFFLSALPAAATGVLYRRGVNGPPSGFTGACDTITRGCPAAYNMDVSEVSSYSGPLFELINPTPVAVITGTISGAALTVRSVTRGTLARGQAVSAVGSSLTPAITPISYITGGSGTSWTLSQSSTISSAATITAYSVLDVPQASGHTANFSSVAGLLSGGKMPGREDLQPRLWRQG